MKTDMNYLEEIEKILEEHRTEAKIICPETCWCWDISADICNFQYENKEVKEIIVSKNLPQKNTPVECLDCGWEGQGDDLYPHPDGELVHLSCPECEDKDIGIVSSK